MNEKHVNTKNENLERKAEELEEMFRVILRCVNCKLVDYGMYCRSVRNHSSGGLLQLVLLQIATFGIKIIETTLPATYIECKRLFLSDVVLRNAHLEDIGTCSCVGEISCDGHRCSNGQYGQYIYVANY